MTSKLETILIALVAALEDGDHDAPVLRGDVLPEDLTDDGLIILRDGDPGEPEVTMSPLTYHYEHQAAIEIFMAGTTDRDARFDALRHAVGAVIAANRTIGGADWIEVQAAAPVDLPVDGADTVKAVAIPVILHFWTSDPLS